MVETLTVHVNREGIHTVSGPDAVESPGSLVVELRNHGEPTHVHLRLGGGLAGVATLGETNHYVDTKRRTVGLEVPGDPEWPISGTLEVVTGYGQESATVDVTLTRPDSAPDPEPASTVTVVDNEDDDNEPIPRSSGGLLGGEGPSLRGVVSVAVIAALAVVLAAAAVQIGGDAALFGAAAVVAGVAVAGYFLYRG